jgi:hypothetical protein
MTGKNHEEFTKMTFSESNQVRTKFINDLFVAADLDTPEVFQGILVFRQYKDYGYGKRIG